MAAPRTEQEECTLLCGRFTIAITGHSGQQADMGVAGRGVAGRGVAGSAYRTWHIKASGVFRIFACNLYSKVVVGSDDKDHLSILSVS